MAMWSPSACWPAGLVDLGHGATVEAIVCADQATGIIRWG